MKTISSMQSVQYGWAKEKKETKKKEIHNAEAEFKWKTNGLFVSHESVTFYFVLDSTII